MALTGVKMTEEVWLACLSHALTTEKEEIMGLLLGDIQKMPDGGTVALIWGASPQVRSDRRKDRVETNPEQLAAASAHAESITQKTGQTTRVIGWYHSHPHITVLPSHVDVRTQAMYQLLDSGFVGLIFSCFNEDAEKVGRIQVIAFQSSNGNLKQNSMMKKSSVIGIESSRSSENATWVEGMEKKSRSPTKDNASVASLETSGLMEDSHSDASGVGLFDLTQNMQEALHRSNMDVSGAEYVRKEIPLEVQPSHSLFKHGSPLSSFIAVQRVLYEEESSDYNQALQLNTREGSMHPLAYIHHTSTYQASLCKLMEHCLVPAINALQDRLKENNSQLAKLKQEASAPFFP
ncbi:uncharacterized protein LOC144701044 [Wolffia australiana]